MSSLSRTCKPITSFVRHFSSIDPFSSLSPRHIHASVLSGPSFAAARVLPLTLRVPAATEIQVRIAAVGICHTDVVVAEKSLTPFPVVLGHEGAGVVEHVGSAVTRVKRGDRVILSYASCSTCNSCVNGHPAYCSHHGSLNFGGGANGVSGLQHDGQDVFGSFFRQSSFATHVLSSETNAVVVPQGISTPLTTLAPLGCGLQTGAGTVLNVLKPTSQQSLVVFGVGAVGMAAIMAASHVARAKHIVAVDRNAERLKMAKKLGATHTVQATDDMAKTKEAILSVCGELDYAFDTTGSVAVLRSATELIRPGGTASFVGAASGALIQVDSLHMLMGRVLRGIIQGDSVPHTFIPTLMDLHARGLFPFEQIITYYDGLDKIGQAVADMKDPSGKVIKPVIKIWHE